MAEKLSMQELLVKFEETLNSGDPKAIAELKEEYGEELGDLLQGMEDYCIEVKGDFEHIDTDCVAGDGSEAYKVFRYKPTGQVIGFDGWYASHEGYNWNDELKEMEPFTITHYRPKD